MKKHILSVLMCLCLALSLVPTVALAADTTNYDIWVGGVQVTSANAADVLGNGTVSYDAQTGTLTLDSANMTGTHTDGSGVGAAIYADTDLTLALTGDNSAIGPITGVASSGVYCSGALAVNGSGSLSAVGGAATSGYSFGVYGNTVTISDTARVNAVGGGYGMASGGSICLNGGTTIAAGSALAMLAAPDLTGYTAAHAVAVGASTDGSGANTWNNTTDLATYEYLKIAPMYSLTVNLDGGSGTTVGGDHAAGEAVSIDAGTKSGYIFSGWTATGGGTFADASGAATTYTMPAGAATITANWAAISSGGGTSTPVITVPVSSDAGTIEVSASVSGTTVRVSGTDAQLQEIASGAEAAGTIKLDVSDLKVDTVVVPSKLISAASGAALEVELPTGTVTLNKDALASVADKGDEKLSVETVDNSALTDTQKEVLGKQADTATVVDINLYAGGNQVSTFGDGTLQVSIPYTLKAGENADSITIWFLKDDGTIEPKCGTYADGKVTFTTQHLSRYLIVNFPFTDVAESAWCYGSVAYVYNSGLFAGTSDTTFSPNTAMTRQMIWMVLARMDGKTPADMDAARAWAVENGISDGSNPANAITREQLAAILYRYAQCKGYNVSVGEDTNILSYNDALTISEYAIPAIQWTCGAGLMQGSGNKLMPFGSATRAQVATILQRFSRNVAK